MAFWDRKPKRHNPARGFSQVDPKVRAYIAAGQILDTTSPEERVEFRNRRSAEDPWQELAWQYYETVELIKYGARFVGNSLSKLRLFPAIVDDLGGPPVPVNAVGEDDEPIIPLSDQAIALATVQRLQSPEGGQADILRDYGVNYFVTGECYLVGRPDEESPTGERFDIYSIDEVIQGGGGGLGLRTSPEMSKDKLIPLDPEDSLVIRIWLRHPRWSALADSPTRGVMDLAEELLLLTRSIRADAVSRLPAGILMFPEDMSEGAIDVTEETTDGEEAEDPFIRNVRNTMITAIETPGTAAEGVPFMGFAHKDDIEGIRWLTPPTDQARIDLEQRKELRERIASGVDLPPEILLGLADVNHWTAWQIDEQTFRSHLEPIANMLMQVLAVNYYRPALRAAGVQNVERHLIWYDPVDLVAHPDKAKAAVDAHKALAISDETLRRSLGFSELDAPTPEETRRRILTANPQAIVPALGPSGEPGIPQGDDPEAAADEAQTIVGAADRSDVERLGLRLAEADRALRARILAAADAAIRRALERAGARLRSKARTAGGISDVLHGVKNYEVAATLGPALVAQLNLTDEDVLEGSFDEIESLFISWVDRAQIEARRLVRSEAPADFDPGFFEDMERQQTEDRTAGAAAFAVGLIALARSRIFDPAPTAPEAGEFDPTLAVPPALARESMSIAGGAAGEVAPGGAVVNAVEAPAGGVSTGNTVMEAFAQATGLRAQRFVWIYGDPGARETNFIPHMDLDGVEFQNFRDPVLDNPGAWPENPRFFPGDHSGCDCDFAAILGPPSDEAEG